MMSMNPSHEHRAVLSPLLTRADSVIIFGSRAADCHSTTSDLDILCIGSGRRIRTRGLDIVWVDRSRLEGEAWLGSELAGHVAKFGRVLSGNADWFQATYTSSAAVQRKVLAISARLKVLKHMSTRVSRLRLYSYGTLVRRDIQRLGKLLSHAAVPPSAHLDMEWVSAAFSPTSLDTGSHLTDIAVPDDVRAFVYHSPRLSNHRETRGILLPCGQ